MLDTPYPELDELLALVGEAGRHLSEIEASEGAAGDISAYIDWPIDVRRRFLNVGTIELPEAAPELAGVPSSSPVLVAACARSSTIPPPTWAAWRSMRVARLSRVFFRPSPPAEQRGRA